MNQNTADQLSLEITSETLNGVQFPESDFSGIHRITWCPGRSRNPESSVGAKPFMVGLGAGFFVVRATSREGLDFITNLAKEDGGWSRMAIQRRQPRLVCGGCSDAHELWQCPMVNDNGFLDGCVICNVSTHQTVGCEHCPSDLENQVVFLVLKRWSLSALAGADWFAVLREYYDGEPRLPPPTGYPWTPKFAIRQRTIALFRHDHLGFERGSVKGRTADPDTASAEAVNAYFFRQKHPQAKPPPS